MCHWCATGGLHFEKQRAVHAESGAGHRERQSGSGQSGPRLCRHGASAAGDSDGKRGAWRADTGKARHKRGRASPRRGGYKRHRCARRSRTGPDVAGAHRGGTRGGGGRQTAAGLYRHGAPSSRRAAPERQRRRARAGEHGRGYKRHIHGHNGRLRRAEQPPEAAGGHGALHHPPRGDARAGSVQPRPDRACAFRRDGPGRGARRRDTAHGADTFKAHEEQSRARR